MPLISSTHRLDGPVPRESDSHYRAFLDHLGMACVALDPHFRVLYCNPAFACLVEVPPERLLGQSLPDTLAGFRDSACHRACRHALEAHTRQEAEERVGERYFLARAYPMPGGVLALVEDVTEWRRAEEESRRLEQQVHRTQKLESLGLLAGGVAHDFNNLLVGILGTAEVLLRDLPADSPQRPLVELVKRAGENAAQLTRQMLTYAGKGPSSRRSLDLNALLGEGRLLAAAVRKSVTFETCLAPGLPLVHADPGQMQQVVLNLVLNAAEAIGSRTGRITLTTSVHTVAAAGTGFPPVADRREACPSSGDLPPGRYVCLEVADDGCGMTPEVAARLFDPFFTTKSSGRGLGMAVVQGIVRSHQGAIRIESAPGRGTTFRVLLPAVALPAPASPGEGSPGRAVVLVVDDEPFVREVTTRALKGEGLAVLAAANGGEGIELLRRYRETVALVLLNLVPGPTATETVAALRRLRPHLKIVLTTGHDPCEAARLCEEWGLTGFLPKPYPLDALFAKVRDALGERPA